MATSTAWAAALIAGVVPVAVASGSTLASIEVDESISARPYRFHHVGQHTRLTYEYDTHDADPEGDVTRFRIYTAAGFLTGRIVVGEPFSRVVLRHEISGSRLVADCTASARPDEWDVHLGLLDRGEDVFFRVGERLPGGVETVARGEFDCAALADSALHEARSEALRRIRFEQEVGSVSPGHLQQIEAALWFAGALERAVDDCPPSQDPAAGRCHLDYDSFGECLDCCDSEADLFSLACNLANRALCKAPWCKKLGKVLCGGVHGLYADKCVEVMCNGKDGDPHCNPTQECGTVPGSACWEFCGITRKSVCGTCAPGQACCAPF